MTEDQQPKGGTGPGGPGSLEPHPKTVARGGRPRPSAQLPKERAQFNGLLAGNPNYFGNLPESQLTPVQVIAGNTSYEKLTCVGYNATLSLLEATVQAKLPGGYGGGLCVAGSTEFVRFFVDYGGGWQDVGLASFNAHDLANITDCAKQPDKPLSYVVTLALQPNRDFCGHPVLPAVRAILSWNLQPPAGNAGWTPVWGNVLDDHIQITPRPWLFGDLVAALGDAIQKVELPPLAEEAFPQPILLPDPPPLQLAELARLYAGPAVQPGAPAPKVAPPQAVGGHRFALDIVHAALLAGDVDQAALLAKMVEFKEAGLDWAAIVAAVQATNADVTYEQLECLGLDYDRERLVATFRVRRPYGYSGDLCHQGSLEHVAFWADWNDTCEWTYLGTVDVNVHDIATIPAHGLSYSAVLPVDLNTVRRPCQQPKIARIRAVLSWSTLPSTVDPDALTTWGNRLDAHTQIKPGDPLTPGVPIISIIGGIGRDNIDVFGDGMTQPGVPFAMFGWAYADEWAPHTRKCPFGGTIIVQGPTLLGLKYRLWVHNIATGTLSIVKDSFFTTDVNGIGTWRTPDPVTGYSSYLPTSGPGALNIDNVLSYWRPSGDDLWEIQLELATAAEVVVGTTPWYRVQLDNIGPVRKPLGQPPLVGDTMDIHIDTGGGDCADFTVGGTISGRFVARDIHLGAYSLTTTPVSLTPPNPSPSSGLVQTAPALPAPSGAGWTLNTTGMQACGYVIVLQVWDRSIVGSYPGSHNYNFTDVGFCLRAPA